MKGLRRRKRTTRCSKNRAGRGERRGHSRSSTATLQNSRDRSLDPPPRLPRCPGGPWGDFPSPHPPEGQQRPAARDKRAWRGALATVGWGTGPRGRSQRGWSDQGARRPGPSPLSPPAAAQRQAPLRTHRPPLTSRCRSLGLHRNPSLRAHQGPSHVFLPPQLPQTAAEESFD